MCVCVYGSTYTHTQTCSWLYSTQIVGVAAPPPTLRPLALQMSVNRIWLWLWLIVLDADAQMRTLMKIEIRRSAFKRTEGTAGCSCAPVQRTTPTVRWWQTPPVGSLRPFHKRARGERGEGREVRGSLGVFTLWLLQRGCPCQRVAMATLFDSYNNARIPLSLPSSSPFSKLHTHAHTHKACMIGRSRWVSPQKCRWLILKRLTMPMQMKKLISA